MQHEAIISPVERYYTGKLEKHGATPSGVDWNSAESQELRFEQLLTLHRGGADEAFSVNDYGCGYGALAEWLAKQYTDFDYRGFDVSQPMLARAAERLAGDRRCVLVTREDELEPADYAVASGIFNVRLEASDEDWRAYVLDTVDRLAELSSRGFAFNMLTSYSDREYMRDDLYYGDPLFFFDHCKRTHSRQVALLHDYGLFEFTLSVRFEE